MQPTTRTNRLPGEIHIIPKHIPFTKHPPTLQPAKHHLNQPATIQQALVAFGLA
jgi:hypothetical protein